MSIGENSQEGKKAEFGFGLLAMSHNLNPLKTVLLHPWQIKKIFLKISFPTQRNTAIFSNPVKFMMD